MNVEEAAFYLGYSKDKIYKLIQEEWMEGVHYHKPTGRVIIDKNEIDKWVTQNSSYIIKKFVNTLVEEK